MNRVTRYQFFALIIILLGVLSYKTYEQYINIQKTQKLVILNESKIAAFVKNYIEVDEKPIEIKTKALFSGLYNDLISNAVIAVVMLLFYAIFIYLLIKKISAAEKKNEKHQQTLFEQSRMAQMGEMISMIAHQWRQPLGAISATSIDLKMKLELETFDFETQEGREEAQKYFSDSFTQIDTLVQSLTTTIDDFRNFYKPDKVKEYSLINIPVHKAYSILEASLKSNNIELVHEYTSKEKLNLYSNELMQVFLNILQNSTDNFISKKISNAKISIKTFDTPTDVVVEICDNGGGVPDDITDKIFDPYFSTKHEKNGTGLGLYMSKKIVEEHHTGKLSVKNSKDIQGATIGACFTIEIKKMAIS